MGCPCDIRVCASREELAQNWLDAASTLVRQLEKNILAIAMTAILRFISLHPAMAMYRVTIACLHLEPSASVWM